MNSNQHSEIGTKVLPGVDLTLWVGLLVLMVFAALAAGITAAAL
jgi:hypothetical protein